MLLGGDSMYGANIMDGKFKVFSVQDIIDTYTTSKKSLQERFYVEVAYGVQCIEHVSLNNGAQEFIISGLDDGTVQVFDYTKNKSKESVQRPVFRIQKTDQSHSEDRPADLDHPYDYFKESLYEHSAPVTAIEKNYKDQTLFATGGKDSKVFLWSLAGEAEVEFITEIGKSQLFKPGGSALNIGYITSLKWYDENVLALSLTNGTLQFNDIRIK